MQLSISNSASSLDSKGMNVLSLCRCTAHLDLLRVSGDALLPGMKALMEFDRVHVQLNPVSTSVLKQSLQQLGSAVEDKQTAQPEQQKVLLPK